jgi:hypothetical protein
MLRYPIRPFGEHPGGYVVMENYDGSRYYSISVHLGNGAPAVGGHLFIIVGTNPRRNFALARDDLHLVDSRGFEFRTGEGFWQRYEGGSRYLLFEVDEEEALSRIRYNDPEYYLTLSLDFVHKGEARSMKIPRIDPVAERPPPRR